MITRLSRYQSNLLHDIYREWLVNIFTRKDFNRPLISKNLERLYDIYKLPIPSVIYADGPLHCQRIATELREKAAEREEEWNNMSGVQQYYEIETQMKHCIVNRTSSRIKQEVWSKTDQLRRINSLIISQLGEQHNRRIESFSPDGLRAASLCCYNDFLNKLSIIKLDSLARNLLSGYDRYRGYIFNSGVFFSIYAESTAIVCSGPIKFMFNDNMELHCSDGPALEWEDGCKLYYLNGISMSKVFFLPANEIDPVWILRESNAEVRREIIRKIGIKSVIQRLGARVVDTWGNYELLVLDLPDVRIRPTYLKMLNPSVGVWHLEGVPPEIANCRQALAWRDGEDEYHSPEQLT